MGYNLANPFSGFINISVGPLTLTLTFCAEIIRTVHQEDLYLDTNMRDQLYMETQLFIHRNLVQYSFTLYDTMTLLQYMTTLPSP